jgi:membrane fusion protein (multidrug efflux system)
MTRTPSPRSLVPLLPLLVLLVMAVGCANGVAEEEQPAGTEESAEETEAVLVEVADLDRGPMERVLRATTHLEAERAVAVHAKQAGILLEMLVEEGDLVHAGDVLARLEDDAQRAALATARTELAKAEREFDRLEHLHGQKLISDQAFNDATYEVDRLRILASDAERELSETAVRAPIAGTITQRLVNQGQQVTLNQHLFDIVDFDSLVARVHVPERELPHLGVGQPARLRAAAAGDDDFPGHIDRIAPTIDPQSGTVKVTVAVDAASTLRPGMYLDVTLVTEVRDDALRVPKAALVYDEEQTFVYRLRPDETVERVLVMPRLEDESWVEAGENLAHGDRIVIAGQTGLKDGAEVRRTGAEEKATGDAS